MKLWVIDNGERYSAHRIVFLEASDLTQEQAEALVKLMGCADRFDQVETLGCGAFEWWKGGVSTPADLAREVESQHYWVEETDPEFQPVCELVAVLPERLQVLCPERFRNEANLRKAET